MDNNNTFINETAIMPITAMSVEFLKRLDINIPSKYLPTLSAIIGAGLNLVNSNIDFNGFTFYTLCTLLGVAGKGALLGWSACGGYDFIKELEIIKKLIPNKGDEVMGKTNLGLVEHCQKALNEKWFYGWGTYGQKATTGLVNQITEKYSSMNAKWKSYMLKAVNSGNRLCDCYGLVKGYLFLQDDGTMKYNSKLDTNTKGAFDKAVEKGTIDTLPEIPGLVLYMTGHVGVYIGNGEFIELMGGGVGAFKGKIENKKITKGSKFTHWFKDINITYVEEKEVIEVEPEVTSEDVEEITEIFKLQDSNDLALIVDDKEYISKRLMINDTNYVKLRDIGEILGYHVEYDPFEKVPILTKKETT